MVSTVDAHEARRAVELVMDWVRDSSVEKPPRAELAAAVRATARLLAQDAPGHNVEVRVPPFVAVQCIEGPRHTRGTPPNVVECDPRTWLRLSTSLLTLEEARSQGFADVSGSRAVEISRYLPVLKV